MSLSMVWEAFPPACGRLVVLGVCAYDVPIIRQRWRSHADGSTQDDLICPSRTSKCRARRVGSGSARSVWMCRVDGRVRSDATMYPDPPVLGQPQCPLGARRPTGGHSLALACDPMDMGHQTLPEGVLPYRRRQRACFCRTRPLGVKTGDPRPPARLIPHPPPVLRIRVRWV
jgi:hypothetical protein